MKIHIKNMVCIRCQMVVKSELEKLGLKYYNVKIGEANVVGIVSEETLKTLDLNLKKAGLELMSNRKSILVEKITSAIIELVHYNE
ncbi:MAG: AraC family transcriptional regulator, partial [Salinivirgaceae bacterium]|nr:AraC family transcriptional regulator [Salinivirgaceae bacterium]